MSQPTATPLQDEMRRLVQEQPELSCAGLMQKLRGRGWQIEQPMVAPEILETTPAWVALLSMRTTASPPQNTPQSPQLLESGQWAPIANVLTAAAIDALVAFCNSHFSQPGLPPVQLHELAEPLRQQAIEAAQTAATETIHQLMNAAHPLSSEPWVLLMNRCLLRRTYPPQQWSEALRNNNNQHWHQDSNIVFGGRAMLTVWIPLQDGAGRSCPGLEASSVPARFFSTVCGDSTPEHEQVCLEHGEAPAEITMLEVARGDGAVFNGLTYHRTGLREGMHSHRDALLLRLCLARDAGVFPGDRSKDLLIA